MPQSVHILFQGKMWSYLRDTDQIVFSLLLSKYKSIVQMWYLIGRGSGMQISSLSAISTWQDMLPWPYLGMASKTDEQVWGRGVNNKFDIEGKGHKMCPQINFIIHGIKTIQEAITTFFQLPPVISSAARGTTIKINRKSIIDRDGHKALRAHL